MIRKDKRLVINYCFLNRFYARGTISLCLLELNEFFHVKSVATNIDTVVNYFYKFINTWYATRLKLGPNQLSIEGDFERAGGDELILYCITEEKQHKTRIGSVLPSPVENLWRLNTNNFKRIDSKDDATNQSKFNKR